LALIGTIVVSTSVGGDYQMEFKTPGAESERATALLAQHFPARSGDSIDIVVKATPNVDDPTVRADVERLIADTGTVPHVVGVVSPYSQVGAFQVSPDRS